MNILPCKVDVTFILNDLDLQITLTFEQSLLDHKHVDRHIIM